jgi:hypothetical protein
MSKKDDKPETDLRGEGNYDASRRYRGGLEQLVPRRA